MRFRFKPTIVPMDCEPHDLDAGPVLLKLTSGGNLVFLNWGDSDHEAALDVFGLYDETSECYRIYKHRDAIIGGAFNNPRLFIQSPLAAMLPAEIADELVKGSAAARPRLLKGAEQAFERTDYRTPSDRWVDTAGTVFKIDFTIAKDTKYASITAETETVWHSTYGKRAYPGKALTVTLRTTPHLYRSLLSKIPSGVIYDPKKGTWLLAAAIAEVIDRGSMIVVAGRQGRGLSIERREALVNKDDDGDWVVKRWL